MKPLLLLSAAAVWVAVAYANDATFVAYVPVLLLVLLAFDAK